MFSTIAYAQEAAAAGERTSLEALIQFAPFILMIAVFWVLVIRPSQKKQKEHQAELKTIKSGDRVMLTSGIYGTVDSVNDDNSFYVTIAPNVKIHVAMAAISTKLQPGAETIQGK